jgi:glycosyltransferase involved in cell wall biosynthesis
VKNVLIISKSPLNRDPRVYKQILFLKDSGKFRVATSGIEPSGIEDDFYAIPKHPPGESIWRHFSIQLLMKKIAGAGEQFSIMRRLRQALQLKLARYDAFYWSQSWVKITYAILCKDIVPVNLIIANDVPVLPLSLRIAEKHKAKVYLDAHEYEPLHYNHFRYNFFYRDYWYSICKRYLPKVDHMTAVCEGIANEYLKNFAVQCQVMMSLPFYEDIKPTGLKSGKIRMIHHGAAAKGRKIENMIALMRHLDARFELDFMMLGMDSEYGHYLRRISSSDSRIRFVPTVKMADIAKTINSYDLGLYLLSPDTFNQKMSLPNKLFEFIQARLAVAIWPSQEMVKIVDRWQNGVYSKEFDIQQMAQVLNRLTQDDIVRMKHNSHLAAQDLNSEKTRRQLLSIVDSLLP